MKKVSFTIIFVLFTAIVSYCEPQNAIIKDVRGEIYDHSAQIVVEANCNIDYLDYTLPNPPRLIIDPVGKIYSNLKEVIIFDSGPVKKVTIVKGRPEEGLTGNFYPLDFVSIELNSTPEYKVRKEIKEEVIIEITEKKDMTAAMPAIRTPQPIIQEAPPEEILPVEDMEEKEEAIEETEEVVPLPEIRIQKTEEEIPVRVFEPAIQPEQAPQTREVIPLETQKEEAPELLTPEVPTTGLPKFVYKIGEGDNLDISVWQHPELDKRVVVRPDGFISFPLAGEVKATGFTPPQLASSIKENLSRLIKDPQVTVIVSGFGSKNIFVVGEVSKPGVYQFRGGINILEAISEAGGWKNSAVLNSVILVRRVFTDQPEAYRLNVYAIIKKGDFTQNMALEPGDVVYVPKSFVANIGGFIENLRVSIGAYITESTKVFD